MMTIVTVRCDKGISLEKKRALVRLLSDSIAGVLNVPPDEVKVIVEEMEPGNMAAGGELHADKFSWGFTWPEEGKRK